MGDHYEALQVARTAPPEVIEAAHRVLTARGGAPAEVHAAWFMLRDPARRARYDASLATRPAATPPGTIAPVADPATVGDPEVEEPDVEDPGVEDPGVEHVVDTTSPEAVLSAPPAPGTGPGSRNLRAGCYLWLVMLAVLVVHIVVIANLETNGGIELQLAGIAIGAIAPPLARRIRERHAALEAHDGHWHPRDLMIRTLVASVAITAVGIMAISGLGDDSDTTALLRGELYGATTWLWLSAIVA